MAKVYFKKRTRFLHQIFGHISGYSETTSVTHVQPLNNLYKHTFEILLKPYSKLHPKSEETFPKNILSIFTIIFYIKNVGCEV